MAASKQAFTETSPRGEPIPESELKSIASDTNEKKDLQKNVESSKQTETEKSGNGHD